MNGYNFTDRVRKVLAMAREEAARLRHEYVGTEHILLALLRDDGVALSVLQNQSVDPDRLRERVEGIVKPGRARDDQGERPYTSRAKKVLELAFAETRRLGHSYVGTEHLLLGLLREEKGIGAQVLAEAGLTAETASTEVTSILGEGGPDARGSSPTDGRPADGNSFLVAVPARSNYQVAFVAMWWTIGIVALIESVRLFMRGLALEGGTSAGLVSVAVLEAVGALLFLAPRTLKLGAAVLLFVFAAGFVGHVFRGQFLTQFLVYAAATLTVVTGRYARRSPQPP